MSTFQLSDMTLARGIGWQRIELHVLYGARDGRERLHAIETAADVIGWAVDRLGRDEEGD